MHKIKLDLPQKQLLIKLDKIAHDIETLSNIGFFSKIFAKKTQNKPQSLYLYSAPGHGKTMLMQKFYEKLHKTPKIYFHFNGFMRQIHETLRDIRFEEKKYNDELIEAVKRIILDKKVLCFDEFQVHDIADAMILGRIFSYLFSQKIFVILTSNSSPHNLYKNGLQREIFLEFVDKILLKNVEVIKLENNIDYRLQYKQNITNRYFISNKKNSDEVSLMIENFTKNEPLKARNIKVWGRDVVLKNTFENVAIINFDEICKNNLGASDYKEICKEFDLIFLLNLPILGANEKNEARRFMLFIDEIYENKTALIILAKCKIDEIFSEEKDKNFYARVVSRLNEIKSDEYWQNSKFIKK